MKNELAYQGTRPDLCAHVAGAGTILDVGCNGGALGAALKRRMPDVHVTGWDYNPEAIAEATLVLDQAEVVDLNDMDRVRQRVVNIRYHTVILGDVLEHLINPSALTRCLYDTLEPGGELLISLPNFAFWKTGWHFLRHRFPRNSRGIYDDSHLHFFMRGNLVELAPKQSELTLLARNFRLIESRKTRADALLANTVGRIPWFREFLTFQFIFRIRKPYLPSPKA